MNDLEKILGLKLSNQTLQEAFTHKSFYNEKRVSSHNERLEFLGDAVLELVVTEELFNRYPDEQEGKLTKLRSAIVNGQFLSKLSKNLNFGEQLKLSKGEEKAGGRDKRPILANVFEAVVGAIYIEKGLEKAQAFISEIIFPYIEEVYEKNSYLDPKSQFQEWAQEVHNITPIYDIVAEEGPDHAKKFVAATLINNKKYGEGRGSSKQKAEIEAARDAVIRHINNKK